MHRPLCVLLLFAFLLPVIRSEQGFLVKLQPQQELFMGIHAGMLLLPNMSTIELITEELFKIDLLIQALTLFASVNSTERQEGCKQFYSSITQLNENLKPGDLGDKVFERILQIFQDLLRDEPTFEEKAKKFSEQTGKNVFKSLHYAATLLVNADNLPAGQSIGTVFNGLKDILMNIEA